MNLDRIIAVRNRKTVYRDGDVCVKVFDSSYPTEKILSEAAAAEAARHGGLDVPAVRGVTTFDGKWAIVSDYVRGETLWHRMRENAADRTAYLRMLAGLQCRVNALTVTCVARLRDILTRNIGCAALSAERRDALTAEVCALPDKAGFCHGDLTPENLVSASDGRVYVLDFSHAASGDAAADAAVTCLWFYLRDMPEAAEEYLALFCAESGAPMSLVRRWMPPVAAALSVGKGERERMRLLSFPGVRE